jgi:hypothetical protein
MILLVFVMCILKLKYEALHHFKTYKAEVENQLEEKIKRLRSDHGGEYFSGDFFDFSVKHGIIHERTPSQSPHPMGLLRERTVL